jgi:hypothetical protein
MAEWRAIPSIPGYEVSDEGQVRHIYGRKNRKLQFDRGYPFFTFRKDGKNGFRGVHTVVAEAFIGPRPDGHQVRHLDGDPGNPRPYNLAYGTALDNALDREWHGRTARGDRSGTTKLPDAEVAKLRQMYANKEANQYVLAALFNISQAQVNNIVLNKQRQRPA